MKKILLIENEINGIAPLKEKLVTSGYEVLRVEDGIRGIHLVHNENPDLIILECLLPNINGCEVCSLLKRDLRYSDIPIIMLSICSHEAIEDSEIEKPDFIFHKPFSVEDLLNKAKELVSKYDSKREEIKQKLAQQDVKWIKEHYIPGTNQPKVNFNLG